MLRVVVTSFLTLALLLGTLPAQYNYKKVYQPDSNTFNGIGFLNAPGIIETGIPGREVAVTGAINGQDTSGFALATFLFQTDADGNPISFDYFADTSMFAFSTPRSFALCYDGMGSFYLATGSNDNQVVARVDTSGALLWATDVNHHDFYDIICEGASVSLMGQDESMIGGHDFSVVKVTDGGISTGINIHGSIDFDIPTGMGRVANGYIMAGQTVGTGDRNMSVLRVNDQLDLQWGHVMGIPGRAIFCQDVATNPAGDAVYATGYVRRDANHPSDSLFVAKIDTAGNPLWMKFYGSDTLTVLASHAIEVDPISSSLLVGGDFDGTGWRSPFVMHLDANGDFDWARNYGEPDTSYEESIEGLAISPDGRYFSATGVHNYIPPSFQVEREFFVIRSELANGRVSCDTSLVFGSRSVSLVQEDIIFTGNPGPPPSVPYGYRRGGGAIMEEVRCQTLVAVDVPREDGLVLAVVNPVVGDFVVDCEVGLEGGELSIWTLQGQRWHAEALAGGAHRIRLSAGELPPGVYLVTLTDAWGSSRTRKVVLFQ